MFIAHLPSGYLLSHTHPTLRVYTRWTMLGAVLPDIDMLYFHLVDAGTMHHHSYLTHRPLLWLGLLILSVVFSIPLVRAVSAGGVLHIALDSVTGAINWGWPVWDQTMTLLTVPATQEWWMMSFLLHWSFAVELVICTVCVFAYMQAAGDTPAPRSKEPAKTHRP